MILPAITLDKVERRMTLPEVVLYVTSSSRGGHGPPSNVNNAPEVRTGGWARDFTSRRMADGASGILLTTATCQRLVLDGFLASMPGGLLIKTDTRCPMTRWSMPALRDATRNVCSTSWSKPDSLLVAGPRLLRVPCFSLFQLKSDGKLPNYKALLRLLLI